MARDAAIPSSDFQVMHYRLDDIEMTEDQAHEHLARAGFNFTEGYSYLSLLVRQLNRDLVKAMDFSLACVGDF
jgi:hypothetical protein